MPTPRNLSRSLLVLLSLVAVALAASGCGTSSPNAARGRVLFIQKCGTCHTLAQAGSSGTLGPNLDDAFAAAREAGEGGDTVEGIVKAQVEFPRPKTSNPAVSMPPDIVTGKDLEDVAAYVGSYAGVPGAAPPEAEGGPGAQVFASNGCGGCHTLSAANAGAAVGPNLDEVVPKMSNGMLEESIVDPNAKIAKGYPANVMPSNFGSLLSPAELKQLIEYLTEATSGGGK
jgi:mono/diheme cytochrome c family protein